MCCTLRLSVFTCVIHFTNFTLSGAESCDGVCSPQQPTDGLPWNLIQIFKMSTGWIILLTPDASKSFDLSCEISHQSNWWIFFFFTNTQMLCPHRCYVVIAARLGITHTAFRQSLSTKVHLHSSQSHLYTVQLNFNNILQGNIITITVPSALWFRLR